MTDEELELYIQEKRKDFAKFSEKKGDHRPDPIRLRRSVTEQAASAQHSGFNKSESRGR